MNDAEHERALRANISVYREAGLRKYVAGAPHLKHRELRELMGQLADEAIGRGQSVLDLGAGNGLASLPWLGRGLRITAIDSSSAVLSEYRQREPSAEIVVADVSDWLRTCRRQYDFVAHVSMLHHIPDYMALLNNSVRVVCPGGSLLTFQDPLLYSTLPKLVRMAEVFAYFSWRLFQGNYRRGLATLGRRAMGNRRSGLIEDYGEYHVVRQGVDANAIVGMLSNSFADVRKVTYWATQGRPQQWLGRLFGLRDYFGVVAKGRLY